jgi:hypothetical protein
MLKKIDFIFPAVRKIAIPQYLKPQASFWANSTDFRVSRLKKTGNFWDFFEKSGYFF